MYCRQLCSRFDELVRSAVLAINKKVSVQVILGVFSQVRCIVGDSASVFAATSSYLTQILARR